MADETQTKEVRRERLADADRRPPGSPAEVGKLDTLKRTVVAADPTFATALSPPPPVADSRRAGDPKRRRRRADATRESVSSPALGLPYRRRSARKSAGVFRRTYLVMVDPGRVSGEGDVFVCGDDEDAKAQVHGAAARSRLGRRGDHRPSATSPPRVRPRLTSCSGCA